MPRLLGADDAPPGRRPVGQPNPAHQILNRHQPALPGVEAVRAIVTENEVVSVRE